MVRAVAHISLVPSAMVVVEEHVHNYCADEPATGTSERGNATPCH